MSKIIILGIGNTLMMDDGIGVYVVNKLSELQFAGDYEIEFVVGEADINYCLEVINKTENLILIDAASLGRMPGDLSIIPFEAINHHSKGWFSHDDSIYVDSNIFKGIKGFLIAIEPYMVNYNFGLSNVLNDKFDEIIDKVKKQIVDYLYIIS